MVEAARRQRRVRRILYASGSGVYGDLGDVEAAEDYGPLIPVSTYGASKLAGEALIASYCSMFELDALRVPVRQRRRSPPDPRRGLRLRPAAARRPDAAPHPRRRPAEQVLCPRDRRRRRRAAGARAAPRPFAVFNVATGDYVTVTEIAELAVEVVGLPPGGTRFDFTGGDRGWRGDVPVVRINTDRIRALGWANGRTGRQALRASMLSMLAEARGGRLSG